MSWVTWLLKSRMRMRSVMGSSLIGCGSLRCDGVGLGSGFSLLRPLANGDEEAVRAMARRRQAEHVASARRLAADRRAPCRGNRERREVGGAGEEALDLRLVFLAQERAGGVDEPSAGRDEARGALDDAVLQLRQLGEVLLGEPPFCIRVAPPGAGAGARRVDEDALEAAGMALDPFVALAAEDAALHDADTGAAQPLRRALQALLGDVAGDEMAAVVHRRGQRQRLAAGAGAEIDDAHARTRIGKQRGELRAF